MRSKRPCSTLPAGPRDMDFDDHPTHSKARQRKGGKPHSAAPTHSRAGKARLFGATLKPCCSTRDFATSGTPAPTPKIADSAKPRRKIEFAAHLTCTTHEPREYWVLNKSLHCNGVQRTLKNRCADSVLCAGWCISFNLALPGPHLNSSSFLASLRMCLHRFTARLQRGGRRCRPRL